MPLGRPATGLPRYFMDCGWYRHPHFAGLPVESLFVFEAIVGYSTEHATDGAAPAHPEDLAAVLGLRASVVRKGLPRLVDRGRLDVVDSQVVVPGWGQHNPTAAEVAALSSERSDAGARGNHQRWHADRDVTDPACRYCVAMDRNSDRPPDANGDRNGSQNGSHGMGWDGIKSSSRPGSSPEATAPGTTDDDPFAAEATRRTAAAVAAGTVRGDPSQYRAKVQANLHAEGWAPPVTPSVLPDAAAVVAAHRVPDAEVAPPRFDLTRAHRHAHGLPRTPGDAA